MISTIIFDAFGTLFEVAKGGSAKYVIEQITSCGHDVNEEDFLCEWKKYYKRHTGPDCAFQTERDIFISRIRMFYGRYGVNRSAESDADRLLAGAYARKPYEEAAEAITRLRQKYRVFIGSNTDNDVLDAVMKNSGIDVDKVYTSENLRCYKPAPLFYEKILSENRLAPGEVLFVGDSLSDDVYGPLHAGIQAVWLNRADREIPDGVTAIRDLRELTFIF